MHIIIIFSRRFKLPEDRHGVSQQHSAQFWAQDGMVLRKIPEKYCGRRRSSKTQCKFILRNETKQNKTKNDKTNLFFGNWGPSRIPRAFCAVHHNHLEETDLIGRVNSQPVIHVSFCNPCLAPPHLIVYFLCPPWAHSLSGQWLIPGHSALADTDSINTQTQFRHRRWRFLHPRALSQTGSALFSQLWVLPGQLFQLSALFQL